MGAVRKCYLAACFILCVGSVAADNGGNRNVAESNSNRSMGQNFVYWCRFTAPINGAIDSIGGRFRDGNDGADIVLLVVHDTTGSGNTFPGSQLDSGLTRITVNNASSTTHEEYVVKSTVRYSVTAGRTYFVGAFPTAVTGAVGVGRNSLGSGFLADSTFLLNSSNPEPLANPVGASSKNEELAFTLFVVIGPTGGGGAGSGNRVLIRKGN